MVMVTEEGKPRGGERIEIESQCKVNGKWK